MWLLVSSLLLCACAYGLSVGENQAAPSPLKYERYGNGSRYLFDPAPQSWADSFKVCDLYNGKLAFPKTQAEADTLTSIMETYNVSQVHIGFQDHFTEGKYYTVKGRLINETTFNQWSAGAPIGGTTRNCGGLRGDGLVDVACTEYRPSICEENDATDNEGYLDYDYIPGHGYYKYYSVAKPWPVAMETCYNEGTNLLILNSVDEHDTVLNHFNITTIIHVGAHHKYADRFFVTVLGDLLEKTGYVHWISGEPSGSYISYPYVAVSVTGLSIQGASYSFVCEKQ